MSYQMMVRPSKFAHQAALKGWKARPARIPADVTMSSWKWPCIYRCSLSIQKSIERKVNSNRKEGVSVHGRSYWEGRVLESF